MAEPRKSLSVISPNDKVDQLRRAFADSGGAAPVDRDDRPAEGLHAGVIEALRDVYDPEIPVNVYDLGLIYAIEMDAELRVSIRMTLTAPGCPVADDILNDVRRKVAAVEGVSGVHVDLVFDPPWTKDRMSEAALLELGLL